MSKAVTKSVIRSLLTPEEAAAFLGVLPETLQVWRSERRYNLPFIKVGSRVRYEYEALLKFIASRTMPGDGSKLEKKPGAITAALMRLSKASPGKLKINRAKDTAAEAVAKRLLQAALAANGPKPRRRGRR